MPLFGKKKQRRAAKAPATRPRNANQPTTQSTAATQAAPKREPLPFDDFLGDRELDQACSQLSGGSWDAVEALLSARQYERWTFDSVARDSVPIDVYQRWAEAAPSAWTYTALGSAHIAHGWKARGEGYADTVGMSQFLTLHEHLGLAKQALHQAIEIDPDNAAPYVHMITLAMAHEGDQDDVQRFFMAAHERSPFHAGAVWKALQAKCPKWGGSTQALTEFGNWVVANAPDGSPALSAAVDMRFELALTETSKVAEISDRMNAPEVSDELVRVFQRLMADMPEPAPTSALYAINAFTYWVQPFCLSSAELNQRAFRAIGNRPTERPWNTRTTDPLKYFQAVQQARIKASDSALANLTSLRGRLQAAGEFGLPAASPQS